MVKANQKCGQGNLVILGEVFLEHQKPKSELMFDFHSAVVIQRLLQRPVF
jgi:hypothetical protein